MAERQTDRPIFARPIFAHIFSSRNRNIFVKIIILWFSFISFIQVFSAWFVTALLQVQTQTNEPLQQQRRA
jgi:uncharacterized membrane protein